MSDDAAAARYGRTLPAGSTVFREGEPGAEMYVIRSGRVQLSRRVRGEERIICQLGPGEFFGELALLLSRPRSATALALEESQLVPLDLATLEDMLRQSPAIAARLLKKLAERLQLANLQVETLLLPDAPHRVAHALSRFAAAIGVREPNGVRVPLSLAELADRTGTREAEVQDVIQRLTRARLVTHDDGGFLIAEVSRLQEFLEFLDLKERFGG